jgi:hypothetical protein
VVGSSTHTVQPNRWRIWAGVDRRFRSDGEFHASGRPRRGGTASAVARSHPVRSGVQCRLHTRMDRRSIFLWSFARSGPDLSQKGVSSRTDAVVRGSYLADWIVDHSVGVRLAANVTIYSNRVHAVGAVARQPFKEFGIGPSPAASKTMRRPRPVRARQFHTARDDARDPSLCSG